MNLITFELKTKYFQVLYSLNVLHYKNNPYGNNIFATQTDITWKLNSDDTYFV